MNAFTAPRFKDDGAVEAPDHGDPVRFRNIWVRPLKAEDEK